MFSTIQGMQSSDIGTEFKIILKRIADCGFWIADCGKRNPLTEIH
jgi:hypothetical protein